MAFFEFIAIFLLSFYTSHGLSFNRQIFSQLRRLTSSQSNSCKIYFPRKLELYCNVENSNVIFDDLKSFRVDMINCIDSSTTLSNTISDGNETRSKSAYNNKIAFGKLMKHLSILAFPLLIISFNDNSLLTSRNMVQSCFASEVMVIPSESVQVQNHDKYWPVTNEKSITTITYSNYLPPPVALKKKINLNELFHTLTSTSTILSFAPAQTVTMTQLQPIASAGTTFPEYLPYLPPQKLETPIINDKANTLTSQNGISKAPVLESESNTNPLEIVISAIEGMFDALKDAYVVDNINTFISVSFAEGFSGIIAGLSSRKFADLLNDKKRDSVVTKLFSTGFFFGGRSFFRAFATVIGVPRPIALVFASLYGTFLSEIIKYIGRTSVKELEKDKDIISFELISVTPDPEQSNTATYPQDVKSKTTRPSTNKNTTTRSSSSKNSNNKIISNTNKKVINNHQEDRLPEKYFISNKQSKANSNIKKFTKKVQKSVAIAPRFAWSNLIKKLTFSSSSSSSPSPSKTNVVTNKRPTVVITTTTRPFNLTSTSTSSNFIENRPIVYTLKSINTTISSTSINKNKKNSIKNETEIDNDNQLFNDIEKELNPEKEVVSKKEIAADITRWLVFDELENILEIPDTPYLGKLLTYFGMGGMSSTAGYALKLILNKKLLNENETLWKDVVEGGILFSTYSLLNDYLSMVAPNGIMGIEFPFYTFLQNSEKLVEEELEELVTEAVDRVK